MKRGSQRQCKSPDKKLKTHLEVLLEHGELELLGALRIIRIQSDLFAHHVPCEDAHTVLTLSAHGLPALEELLSQLVHLQDVNRGSRGRQVRPHHTFGCPTDSTNNNDHE